MPLTNAPFGPSGGHPSIAELAKIYTPALRRYFRRKGLTPPDDEDAAQEVFMRLTKRFAAAAEIESIDRYLFTTAASVVMDLHRRSKSRGHALLEPYEENRHAQSVAGPDVIYTGREAISTMILALKELPERTRVIFILARLEQMKQTEIAKRLGVSLATVEKSLSKALAYLSERMELDQ